MGAWLKGHIWTAIIIILSLALATLLVLLAIDLRDLHRSGLLKAVPTLRHRRFAVVRPMLQPAQIQGWMTFRYINFVFRLSPDYLSGKLDVTDPAYPNTTLDKYAATHQLDNTAFVRSVRETVTAYPGGGSQ